MKSLDSDLAYLSDELERLDYVVVKHGDYVCVRLPLITSVQVHHADGRYRFIPQVGPFRRSVGLFATSGVAVAAVGGTALTIGLVPITFVVGFLGVVALAHDACRFVLTEGCLTRLQQMISSRHAALTATSGTIGVIAEAAPYTFFEQRAADKTPISR